MKQHLHVYGLLIGCPFDLDKESCPLKELRKLSLPDRFRWAKEQSPHYLRDLLQEHRMCTLNKCHSDGQ